MSGEHGVRTIEQRIAWTSTRWVTALVLVFLMAPILAIMPLSFSSSIYLTYPLPGLSLRWYEEFLTSPVWMRALKNSLIIGVGSTFLSMILGTLAALGLNAWQSRFKPLVLSVVLSPMVVPMVITAVGTYFFFAPLGLTGNYAGLILVHTALFAFGTSFDEVVTVLFLAGPEQRTLPREMFSGIRENISPTITAAAVILTGFSVLFLASLEWLRRRNEKLQGKTK